MPHVYKMSEHPTDKGYKEEEKNSQKNKKKVRKWDAY